MCLQWRLLNSFFINIPSSWCYASPVETSLAGIMNQRSWMRLREQLRPLATRGRWSHMAVAATLWPDCHFRSQKSVISLQNLNTKKHGGLIQNVDVWWTSGALQINVNTRAFKKKPFHGFSANQQACCIMLTAIKKQRSPLIFFSLSTCLWALILHCLKNLARSIYSQNVYQILRMRAADLRRGSNVNASDREKACGLRS